MDGTDAAHGVDPPGSRGRRRAGDGALPRDSDDTAGLSASGQHWLVAMALALLPGMWLWSALPPASLQLEPPAGEGAHKPSMEQARQGGRAMAMPMPFEANSGQFDGCVAFMGRTSAGAVFVTRQGQIVYSLPAPVEPVHEDGMGWLPDTGAQARAPAWSLTETLAGAQPLSPVGGQASDIWVSRFAGPNSYRAATYRNILLGRAWPGIEVELAARGDHVETLFHVAPQADAGQIQVRVDGAQSLRLGEQGELIVATGHGDVVSTAPVAFQDGDGQRAGVPVRYLLDATGGGYGFVLADYDPTRPLVIGALRRDADPDGAFARPADPRFP
ncbi:Uncharacterised protein [Delftia tsuruhatensis]|nr:Uncharacterised protein [Delftia tsuruhatensis]CAC9675692.1 Uncharacterised protein [Delftia tsuruhatensis]